MFEIKVFLTFKMCTYANWIVLNRTFDWYKMDLGGTRGVMVIVVGNGHGDTSSNPGRDWLHFT